jgi:predicted esterase
VRLAALPTWVTAAALLLLVACGGEPDATASEPISATLDTPFRFDEQGSLPAGDTSALPVEPDVVSVRWYGFRGWYTAVFEGIAERDAAGLCFGASIQNASTRRFEHISHSSLEPTACNDRGIGADVLGAFVPGARACEGELSYVTRIPTDLPGVLVASLTVFPGDGTGLGLSSAARAGADEPPEIDASRLDCSPLPQARATTVATAVAAALTPAPASTASTTRAPAPLPTAAGSCQSIAEGSLEEITDTGTAPYFVRVPPDADDAEVVIFLPGGSGGRSGSLGLWRRLFEDRREAADLIVVLPYSLSGDIATEGNRVPGILNEVLWCYGGDPEHVHLAGTSNGGLAAFAIMSARPEHFATLLGAPGAFPVQDPATVEPAVWTRVLGGRAVFNGVGELDGQWRPEVTATHNALAAAGIESVYVEFAGEGHGLRDSFDPAPFFAFWEAH